MTGEEIQARAKAEGTPGYGGWSRDRGLGPGPGRALRFRTPDTGETVVHDAVRGEVRFANDTIEDFVLLRGNGTPIFLLANVVDDLEMGITHVVRAEEHLPNTPKQQLLWEALGHQPPVWAHVPVLVNESRKKLSKRRDKVALEGYRDEGYLAEAMVNYLMTLGWAPKGDTEIVPWSVIEDEFRLEDVTHSPAFFDVKKLTAFNGDYIRALPVDDFVAACEPWIPADYDREVFARIAPELQSRAQTLAEVPAQVDFLFADAARRRGVVGQGDGPAVGRQAARRRDRRVRDGAVGRRRAGSGVAGGLGVARRQAEADPGPGARRRHRAASAGRRCSSRSSSSGATRRCAGCAVARRAGAVGSDAAAAPTTRRSGRSARCRRRAPRTGAPGARRPRPWRWVLLGVGSSSSLAVGYYAITLFQVWSTGRSDYDGPADAIVVMGAAQYDGRPSPQLAARLDHVVELWPQGPAPLVVVTGGKRPGDRFTEAEASAAYLEERGVPADGHRARGPGHEQLRVAARRRRAARGARPRRGPDRHRPVPRPAQPADRRAGRARRRTSRRRRRASSTAGEQSAASCGRPPAWPLGRLIGFEHI